MKNGIKIVTIGGGSSYTPELINGFIKRYEQLPIREIWLVDIEEGKEKLNIVGNLARRMVKKAGLPIEIHLTTDRREALKDADFVTTQFRVGGLDGRILDESIPLKHGIMGQETNGPGGLFLLFRTLPVLLEIDKDMAELCPGAFLINFTNPAGMVTEGVMKYGKNKKIIGVCNVPVHMKMNIAKGLGVSADRLKIDFAGLNHFVYGKKVYLDGEDITERVVNMTAGDDENKLDMKIENIIGVDYEPEFLKSLEVIPCYYHSYYYKTKEMLEHQLEDFNNPETGTRAEIVKQVEEDLFKLYADEDLDVMPELLKKRGGAYYSDAACELINAIYNDSGLIHPVNTMNNGAIECLPDDCAVEVSCVITKDGPKPIEIGELPTSACGLLNLMKSFERVALEAAYTGDYRKALLAMTMNPLLPSDKVAKVILDEMLEAHKEYLPQFNK